MKNDKLLTGAAWSWFIFGLSAAVATHIARSFAVFEINHFDGALRLLQSVYAAKRLIPYVDYGFVYPPGYAWLFGNLLGIESVPLIISAESVLNFLLISILTCLLMSISANKRDRLLLGGLSFLFIGAFCSLPGPIFSPVLMGILSLLSLNAALHGPTPVRLALIALVAAANFLMRWDWVIFNAVLLFLLAGSAFLFSRIYVQSTSAELKKISICFLKIGVAEFLGILVAAAVFFVYAIFNGSLKAAYSFVFEIPLAILPYRQTPIPLPQGKNAQWLWNLIAIGAIAACGWIAASRDPKNKIFNLMICLLLLIPCFALIPYMFGRADFPHAFPLTILLVLACSAAWAIWNGPYVKFGIPLLLLFLMEASASLSYSHLKRFYTSRDDNWTGKEFAGSTKQCIDLFPADARSLFVGQVSYRRYIINFPILYLMRSDLRPATTYLSDEPGLQNSCSYGAEIAAQVRTAKRPLVFVRDTSPWPPEKNLTLSMTSCNKIEEAYESMKPQHIGFCRMYGRTLEISVAR